MINKVYDKIKQILKENFKALLIMLIVFLLCTISFPYYINAPGGLINVNDRIEIEGAYKSSGSLNMAYVSEIKATIPTLLYSLFNKSWDVLKEEDLTYENETIEDTYLRDRLLLEEATNNAIIVGFTKANKKVEVLSSKLIVTYVDAKAQTDLKIGDEIISIDSTQVSSTNDIHEVLAHKQVDSEINIKVLNDGKELNRKALLYEEDTKKIIGIMINEQKEIQTDPKVELNFKKSESGPSGGLMTALAIYNSLTSEDITRGKKIVGTGTIDEEGNVGSIGGVKYKLEGAVNKKAEIFFVPNGENYEEAIKLKKKNNYKIEIIGVSNIDDAINYLMDL